MRNLEKVFEASGSKFFVLRRISIDIQAGEFVTFMGPSGAGKSTLLSIIGMLDSAWSGEYYFLDQPVHKLNVKKRNELHKANIGFVFQSYHLIDNLTVFENLEIPLSYKNVPHKERVSLVCDVLDRFNIVGKKDLFPNQLSGGQQQLVGVARAVIQNPKLILADEPTGNLHCARWISKHQFDARRGTNRVSPSFSTVPVMEDSHEDLSAGSALRRSRAPEKPRFHRRRDIDACARHRREHRHFQRGQHRFAQAPAV